MRNSACSSSVLLIWAKDACLPTQALCFIQEHSHSPAHPSIYPSAHPFTYPSTHPFIHPSTCPCIHSSICPSFMSSWQCTSNTLVASQSWPPGTISESPKQTRTFFRGWVNMDCWLSYKLQKNVLWEDRKQSVLARDWGQMEKFFKTWFLGC